jgi:transposase-like protein
LAEGLTHRAEAIRQLVLDHLGEYRSVYAAAQAIGPEVGVGPETLRKWVLQAQIDAQHSTASWTTYCPRSTSAPITLKPRGPSRRRLNHEAGIKPETVQGETL